MSKPTKEEATKIIRKAAAEGRVQYANPGAVECFPVIDDPAKRSDAWGKDFHYLVASPILPFSADEEDKKPWEHAGGIHFQWGLRGVGFGEVSVVLRDGKWVANTESLGRKFVEKLLLAWVKKMRIK